MRLNRSSLAGRCPYEAEEVSEVISCGFHLIRYFLLVIPAILLRGAGSLVSKMLTHKVFSMKYGGTRCPDIVIIDIVHNTLIFHIYFRFLINMTLCYRVIFDSTSTDSSKWYRASDSCISQNARFQLSIGVLTC